MGITKVAVGDLSGIREGSNFGARTNQKLHNFWSHRHTIEWIRHLCEDYGMEFVQMPERGTSKTCCICGQQHNGSVHRGLHVCEKNRTMINADVSGAANIWKVAVKGALYSTTAMTTTRLPSSSRVMAKPLVLRWDYARWK